MNFQTFVGTQPSPAVAGDFASANPRASVLAGPGGLIAGPSGVLVGRFGWLSYDHVDSNDAPAEVNNHGLGVPDGFIHREQQGLITQFLSESSMLIPTGFAMTLMSSGDYWVVNSGASEATPGMACYADVTSGLASFGAGGFTSATGVITAGASSFTGSIANDLMTVTVLTSGSIYPGTTVTGASVATGTQVANQVLPLIAGEALNGVGRYDLTVGEQTVASEALTGAYGILTISGSVTGSGFTVGDIITGTGVVTSPPTEITALISGTGGAGTYAVNNATPVSSATISAGNTALTKWTCRSTGLSGELVKISSNPQ